MDDATLLSLACPEAAGVLSWLFEYRKAIDCTIERIPFGDSSEWALDKRRSFLGHASGRFFTIHGFRGASNYRPTLYQPLIDQPETGTQGFIVRRVGTDFELLVQARTEPGNVGIVQIGPTIQATYSNYTAVHNGKRQPFLEHFHHPEQHGGTVILDTVQPELGSKFLKKWNRNIVIETSALAEFSDPMFKWVSLKTMTRLMNIDHLVNNDARLVVGLLALTCGDELFDGSRSQLGELVSQSFASQTGEMFTDVEQARKWVELVRSRVTMEAQRLPLIELPEWQIKEDEISHKQGHFFSVIQVQVHAADREVTDWDQPLIDARHTGEIVLVCKEFDGVLNLLFHAEPQIGNANGVELQPTFCFDNEGDESLPDAIVALLNDDRFVDRFTFEGSDEGGRFYQCVSKYDIRWMQPSVKVDLPENYCWLTLAQIRTLLNQTDFVSDEARSALSLFLTSAFSGQFQCELRIDAA